MEVADVVIVDATLEMRGDAAAIIPFVDKGIAVEEVDATLEVSPIEGRGEPIDGDVDDD